MARKRYGERAERVGGGGGGPSQQCNYGRHLKPTGFVAARLAFSLPFSLCTLAAQLIAIATAISTVHDINMVACRRQREAVKGT